MRISKGIFSCSRLLREGISRGCEECDCFFVKQSLQKDIKLVTLNGKMVYKTNFMGSLRKRISPEQIIQRNWSYKIQVFKIAAKAEKDKTQKQSQRMKNNLNRCVLAF